MVTGLGGVFIKANDPKYLARWYEDNLGIGFGNGIYFPFKWRDKDNPDIIAQTVFSFFREDTTYFYPGSNDVMINLRVNDLDSIRIQLKKNGVFVIDKVESYENGRLGWALDPAGNKIELWEAADNNSDNNQMTSDLRFVNGFGGVFLKCPDPQSLMEWYSKEFGLFFSYSSHTFQWKELYDRDHVSHTVLSFFSQESSYFYPSNKNYMLNFRVANLKSLMNELISSGVYVFDKTEEYEYGKFGWFLDPEGNKIELWEPVDEKFVI